MLLSWPCLGIGMDKTKRTFVEIKLKSRWRCPAQGGALVEEDPPGNSHHRRRPQLHQHFRCFFKYILRFQQIKSTIRTNTISNFDKYTLHLTIPIAAHFLHFWHLIDMFDTPIFYINSFSTRNQGYNQL